MQIRKPTKKDQGIYGCAVANHLGSDVESSSVLYAGNARYAAWSAWVWFGFLTLNSGAAVSMLRTAESPGKGMLKQRSPDPIPRGSDTAGLEWSLSMCTFFGLEASGILVPQPRIKPMTPALEARRLNHWNTREVPECAFLTCSQVMPTLLA